MNLNIEMSNETDLELPSFIEDKLKSVIETALLEEGFDFDGEVSILFTDEKGIQEINRDHRNKDVVTDVLSFPQYEALKDEEEVPEFIYYGDVVICVAQAERQAIEFGHSLEREFFYLTVHSILHLLGYDHIDEEDKKEMRQREKHILKVLGIFK